MKKHILLLSMLLATLAQAHAREWHVSPTGADSNTGASPQLAFRTLQKAESMVQPGDVVLLGGGVYRSDPDSFKGENSALLKVRKSGTPDAWITWKARPGHKPELQAREWSAIESMVRTIFSMASRSPGRTTRWC